MSSDDSLTDAILWLAYAFWARENWQELDELLAPLPATVSRAELAWARLWLALHAGDEQEAWRWAAVVWPTLEQLSGGVRLELWSEPGWEEVARLDRILRRWPGLRQEAGWRALEDLAAGQEPPASVSEDPYLRSLLAEFRNRLPLRG